MATVSRQPRGGSIGPAGGLLRGCRVAGLLHAVFQAAKAVRLLRNVRIRKHRGLRDVFSLHIVRVGLIEPEWGREIGRLSDLRALPITTSPGILPIEDAIRTYERADGFGNRIQELISNATPADQLQ